MVRLYTQKEKTNCAQLMVAVFSAPPYEYDWLQLANMERYVADLAKLPNFFGVTYWTDGGFSGFCLGQLSDYFVGKSYEIKEIFVSPHLQGSGHGKLLLQTVEQMVKQQGVDAVNLFTDKHIPAFGFYKHLGYAVCSSNVSLSKQLL